MNEPGQTRRLAAILAADVAGYSRLMGDDDKATVQTLTEYRKVFVEQIERHQGKVVDTAGDSVLATFESPVESVACAIEIQRELSRRNRYLADDRQMKFRIGINLGDVIARDDGTVYGDGVNIAARLESLAEPGGIAVSGAVFDQIENKLPVAFEFAGEQQVKNIAKPVRAYRSTDAAPRSTGAQLLPGSERKTIRIPAILALVIIVIAGAWLGLNEFWADSKGTGNALALPKGPSIAVLPFNNLSGNKDDDYFSDGISEDIITALSRFKDLFVIARNSTFQFKGKAVDVREVGKNLGVQYVLEGSVRRDQSRIRLSAQLLDARTGSHLWAENYDRDLTANSVFSIQDELTSKVVSKIGDPLRGMISQTGMRETNRQGKVALGAYECVLKAKAYYASLDSVAHGHARDCLEQVTQSDPTYADAWGWLALVFMDEYAFSYNARPNSLARSLTASRRAIDLDGNNQMARWFLARALFYKHDVEQSVAEAQKAVDLNLNNATVLAAAGMFISYAGQWERGKRLLDRALALDPYPPGWYYFPRFLYHYKNGDYEEALAQARKINLPGLFWTHAALACAYGQLGRKAEAEEATRALLAAYPDFPNKVRDEMRKYNNSPQIIEKYVDGLRKAGLTVPNA